MGFLHEYNWKNGLFVYNVRNIGRCCEARGKNLTLPRLSRLIATAGHLQAGVVALLGAIRVVIASLKRRDLERSLEAFGAELTELAAAWQLRQAVSPKSKDLSR